MPQTREEYNAYMNEYMTRRWQARREEAIDFLGGECVECGAQENLQFHHVDPTEKSWNVSKLTSIREDLFWLEIEKCELRCQACHINEHKAENEHGTVLRYWQKCRCVPCRQAMSVKNKEYRLERKARTSS